MKVLDLHRKTYEEARHDIEWFMNSIWQWEDNEIGEIITGHSPQMLEMVEGLATEYQVKYEVGGPLGVSRTFVRIYN
jgi:hypothetical protein